jgi:hypothetical protein
MAFKGFAARYRRPELSEGFQDIMELPFQVSLLLSFPDFIVY